MKSEAKNTHKKGRQALFWVLIVILALVFIFAVYSIYSYFASNRAANESSAALASLAVTSDTESEFPLTVDFDALQGENSDIVAWLYSPDTPINYPVVWYTDNDYYLHRLTDGSYNSAGTLFVDCACSKDFLGFNTIIYGHNMRVDTMFGTLTDYSDQSYYDAHPTMWLATPNQNYRVDLFSGFVTKAGSEIYTPIDDVTALADYIENAASLSTFEPNDGIEMTEHVLVLSTCSYQFNNARYVLMGYLVPCA